MLIRNFVFRLGLLLAICQFVPPEQTLAAQDIRDHCLLLFFSCNVLGELEPCG